MLVSVIIPAFNCKETLKLAVDSILLGSYTNIEILIIDDEKLGIEYIKKIYETHFSSEARVRYFKNTQGLKNKKRRGINTDAGTSARNLGLQESRGEWVTFQDSDDFSLLNRIEIQLDYADKYKSNHVTIECLWAEKAFEFKSLNLSLFLSKNKLNICTKVEIDASRTSSMGVLTKKLPDFLFSLIPFRLKASRFTRGFFFLNEKGYPGSANCSLIKKELLKNIRFRQLDLRRWPSFRGRGTDRDFNYQVSELANSNSIKISIPLYCWSTPTRFSYPIEMKNYINS